MLRTRLEVRPASKLKRKSSSVTGFMGRPRSYLCRRNGTRPCPGLCSRPSPMAYPSWAAGSAASRRDSLMGDSRAGVRPPQALGGAVEHVLPTRKPCSTQRQCDGLRPPTGISLGQYRCSIPGSDAGAHCALIRAENISPRASAGGAEWSVGNVIAMLHLGDGIRERGG